MFFLRWPSPFSRNISVRWLLAKIVAKRQRFKNSLAFYTRPLPSYSSGCHSGHKYVTSVNYLFLTKIFGFGRLPCFLLYLRKQHFQNYTEWIGLCLSQIYSQ
jgi:hypothetical protein